MPAWLSSIPQTLIQVAAVLIPIWLWKRAHEDAARKRDDDQLRRMERIETRLDMIYEWWIRGRGYRSGD